ncbi:hypothetical protein C5E07_00105 [Pseudoclavibacter sp. RFBJ3]|uniref:hypothetical protein n=1 Tax=unclassified Pseudoclavibacter TaxID=2615177 RepID=UPI000CE90953|nr:MULTISPECIES: hypothetical protein [unclassified Pseudoclavibacter]MBF4550760.1 hypothetical protein [Pseudoclavibacter sp. VKM Ac-2888]PPF34599.1 hypothetical protein C5E05_14875 [Pseudoclavibacter sp. AY1H1]PPF72056.1 hypothetical protein C5B99_18435 [Pseudoclavibacter sp. Z016]PPF86392.1 hypothetical protein C5C12_01315 [Pseudoclavibacter sp. RFBJ5]PPF95124.1 hypothetical protein C5E07_00105 [Pseudoclavibacter sp. RFBJ3]
MRTSLHRILHPLFGIAMIVFLLLAFVLVFAQVIGLIFAQPWLIEGASETLLHPAIISAIVVGLIGYALFNCLPKVEKKAELEDEDED